MRSLFFIMTNYFYSYIILEIFCTVLFFNTETCLLADGDIGYDSFKRDDVFFQNLDIKKTDLKKHQFLVELGLNYRESMVTGNFTKEDLPVIFKFASDYTEEDLAVFFLTEAAMIPSIKEDVLSFIKKLADNKKDAKKIQLTYAELLIDNGKKEEALAYLQQASKLVFQDINTNDDKQNFYNSAILSKTLLLLTERSRLNSNNLDFLNEKISFRHKLEKYDSLFKVSNVVNALFVSCYQDVVNAPRTLAVFLPLFSKEVEYISELVFLLKKSLHSLLNNNSISENYETVELQQPFQIIYQLGFQSEMLQEALIHLAEHENHTESLLLISFILDNDNKDYPVAAKALTNIFSSIKKPSNQLLLLYANILRKAKKFEESSRFFRILGGKNSQLSFFLQEVAINLFSEGKYKDCVVILKHVENSFQNHYLASLCFLAMQQYHNAYQEILIAKKLDQEKTATLSFAMLQAEISEKIFNIEHFEGILIPYLDKEKDNAELYNMLGYVFAEHDYKLNDAMKYISYALKLEPLNSAFLDSCAWIYYKKRDYVNAKKMIDNALRLTKINEIDAVVLSHAGDIYFVNGDKENALKFWKRAVFLNSKDADYDGLEWRINGGTPERWEKYKKMIQATHDQFTENEIPFIINFPPND